MVLHSSKAATIQNKKRVITDLAISSYIVVSQQWTKDRGGSGVEVGCL